MTNEIPQTPVLAPRADDDFLDLYRKLHDGLSDMIECSRLTEDDIPLDYQWLVAMLVEIASKDPK